MLWRNYRTELVVAKLQTLGNCAGLFANMGWYNMHIMVGFSEGDFSERLEQMFGILVMKDLLY